MHSQQVVIKKQQLAAKKRKREVLCTLKRFQLTSQQQDRATCATPRKEYGANSRQ